MAQDATDKTVAYFVGVVTRALKAAGGYSKAKEPMILAAASAMRALDLANHDIDFLDCTTVDTAHGIVAHPAFRIRKEAEDSLLRQLKALGLSADSLSEAVDEDPLLDLTKKLSKSDKRRAPQTIRPADD